MLQGLSLRRCQKCGDVKPDGRGEVKRQTEMAGSKQQHTNFRKVWVCSSDPGLETSFTLNCYFPSMCTQILLPSSGEPVVVHTLPHAHKIRSKLCSKNATEREAERGS